MGGSLGLFVLPTTVSRMTDSMAELTATVTKLTAVNERRGNLIAYRDRQIVAALDAGATWAEVQRVTGLSLRGLALARKRAVSP